MGLTEQMSRLDGKTVLVTGASSGIGRGIAAAMAEAGADVLPQGRDEGRLAEAADAIRSNGASCATVVAELTADSASAQIVDAAVHAFGKIDVLVHNAGIFEALLFADTPIESFGRHWAVNVRAPFALTGAALRHLQPGGSVIFISSIAGLRGFPNASAYCATKGGG